MQSPTIESQPTTQHFTNEAVATVLAEMLSERFTDGGRLGKAADIVQFGSFRGLPRYGQWAFVNSCGKGEYIVTEQTCSCPDHQGRGIVCKHIAALVMFGRLIRLTELHPEPPPTAPRACPRCGKANLGEWDLRAIRSENCCCACISAEQFPDEAA